MVILVKEIMDKPLIIDENKNVQIAGEMMRRTRRYATIVVRKNKPIGILTDSDLIKKIIAKNIKPSSIKVKAVMTKPLVTSDPNDTILDATRKMKRNNIKRIAVLDKDKLVGILSLSDIARSSPEMIDLLEYKLKMREYPAEIKEEVTSGICENCGNYSANLKNVDGQWLDEACTDELED